MSDFTLPDYTPIYPITKIVKPRQRTARFPDWGIEQRATVGQNQTSPEWSVKWILLPAEADILDEFLAARARRGEWFLWTPPGGTVGRYRCDDWTKSLPNCSWREFQATFRQVYGYELPDIAAETGAFTLSGLLASFRIPVKIFVNTATFTLSGAVADLSGPVDVLVDAGVFTLSGLSAALDVGSDPYFSNVSLLLHMDGTNGSTTFVDDSNYVLTPTANGNAQISTAQSKFGGASALFDGTGDFLSVNSSAVALAASNHTVETWVRLTTLPSTRWGISYNGNTASNDNRIQLEITPTGAVNLFLQAGTGTGVSFTSTATLSTGIWYHVAYTKSGDNVYVFIDGALEASGTYSTAISTNNNFYAALTRSASATWSLDGYLDDFRVTKGVARYTAAFTPPVAPFFSDTLSADPNFSSVSLLLPMDGTNGSTIFTDTSNYVFTPTVTGDAQISTAQSKFGGASALFDGNGDYLTIANNAAFQFSTGDFTIETWFYASALATSFPTLVGNGNATFTGTGSTGAFFAMVSGAPRKLNVGTNTTNPIVSSTTTIVTGQWYHVALTRSGSTVRLFLNGVLESTATNSQSLNISNNGLQIGRNGWDGVASHWNGYIDDLRITKGLARYTASFVPPARAFPSNTLSADPYFSSVSLLLHADGTNGSTTFTNSSGNVLTVTANGNAQISTAQSKFGGASALFDGTGDFLSIPSNSLFSFPADFTIEFWIYVNASTIGGVLANGASAFATTGEAIIFDHGTALDKLSIWSYPNNTTARISETPTLTLNTWHHAAFVRSGTSLTSYLNGVAGTTGTASSTLSFSLTETRIGKYWGGDFNGYIDDLRITKGVARYTASFTPPALPFPNA